MLITPHVARDLAGKFKSKEALEKALIAAARRPVAERAYANYWGNPGSAFDPASYSLSRHTARTARREGAASTAVPPWLAWTGKEKLDTVPVMTAGKTALIVTGDAARNKTMCVPGGGFASVKIILPKNWDRLMKDAGYRPLSDFCLKSDLTPSEKPQQFRNYRRRDPGGSFRRR